MNLIGKIFVVLVFAMSLMFMAFAVSVYATHKNWRELIEGPNGYLVKIKEAKEKQDVLKDELEKLTAQVAEENAAKRKALADLETYRKENKDDFDRLVEEKAKVEKDSQESVAAMSASQVNLDKMTKEVEGLRQEIRDVQTDRDKQFQKVVVVTDQVNQVKGEIARLTERQGQVNNQLAAARNLLARHNISLGETDVPPPLRGKVLAINQNDLLEVSLGSDDGLRAGNTLEVYRGTSYLGRVQVLTTQSDRAVGKVLPDFKKGVIQKGDDVATRFKVS
jgi:hypothetical protein